MLNRMDRSNLISLLISAEDDPTVVPDVCMRNAQLIFESGLCALDNGRPELAERLFELATQLTYSAFLSYLRSDIRLAQEADGLLNNLAGALADVRGIRKEV